MIKKNIRELVLLLLFIPSQSYSLSIGSNTACSRQALITFPATDSNNTMLGFAAFENGFTLASKTTTCTYNDFLPISGLVTMNGGGLYLLQDLVISNPCTFMSGGRFYGNARSIEFAKQLVDVAIPDAMAEFSLVSTASTKMSTSAIVSLDWSMSDQYLASCSANAASRTELRVYYFDGTKLTTTKSVEFGRNVNSLDWNSQSNYLALARDGVNGDRVFVYFLNTSNGTMANTSSAGISGSSDAKAVAWHSSGNFLVAGTNRVGEELYLFPFSQTTGLLGTVSILGLGNSNNVSNNALSWAPGGNYLAVGTGNNTTVGATELLVCSFNGSSLTLTTSANIAAAVQAIDWSPTGTYVAVGTSGLTTNLRVYNHQALAGTLREQQSARQTISTAVQSVQWDKTGRYLLVGIAAGASSSIRLYYFDPTALTLKLLTTLPSAQSINRVRWSHANFYQAYGDAASNLVVTALAGIQSFLFNNVNLIFNSNANINATLSFQGNCKIIGQGKRLILQPNGSLVIRSGSNLIFEDVMLSGVQDNRINCMTDGGSMTLRNSLLELSSDYTFSRGSILFDQDVMITGTNKFNYTTGLTSTIARWSMLYFGLGTTFSYNPRVAKNNLLNITDATSSIYFDGSTLHSTRTGLHLTDGTLIIDESVTFSSEAQYFSEAMMLGSGLSVKILNGGSLDLQGLIRYD